ncbi:hypothetical protein WICPIJ_001151 [Wickerhamomyces pijperi]|uniref:Uncharacterized protein n=1 Tax=Wickerhamomyces pijperi TaxID=599730 RepID=A0A9P8TQ62_WICPI|nr:hypothetical protein WICPIJ_001151 [Wickerhamomyces pijperi]
MTVGFTVVQEINISDRPFTFNEGSNECYRYFIQQHEKLRQFLRNRFESGEVNFISKNLALKLNTATFNSSESCEPALREVYLKPWLIKRSKSSFKGAKSSSKEKSNWERWFSIFGMIIDL